VSQPIISQRGVHIVRLDAISEQGRALSQIFFPMEVAEDDIERARQLATATYNRLQAGEPFALVATEVSSDPVTARQGGDLGTFRLEELSTQFQEELEDVPAGEFTEPFLTPAGFYIFLVKERTAGHRLTYEEVREDLRRAIEAQKMEAELTRYVEELRERFFIDLKG
jgi:peptidyl-prolyl cis-trans isomerase SurA